MTLLITWMVAIIETDNFLTGADSCLLTLR
jgi:hypothetical protein